MSAPLSKSYVGAGKAVPITSLSRLQRGAVKRHIDRQKWGRKLAQESRASWNNKGQMTALKGNTPYFPSNLNEAMRHLKRNETQIARVPVERAHSPRGATRPMRPEELYIPNRSPRTAFHDSATQHMDAVRAAIETLPVKKSYVPGVGWRAATKLTARQRALVPGGHAKAMGMSRGDKKFKRKWDVSRNMIAANPETFGAGVTHQPGGWSAQAATYRVGSAKRGKSYVTGSAPNARVAGLLHSHETQHAIPQRSSYRLHRQILGNPIKTMREEARADYRSTMGHYAGKNPSGYAVIARAQEKATRLPNRPSPGSKQHAEMMRTWGDQPDFKRMTNSQLYRAAQQHAFGTVNYRATDRQADRAVDAYRDLQNHLRAKGVPEGPVSKKLSARLGAHYTVRLTHLADKLEPKAVPVLPKGRLKVIHPKNGVHLGRTATANTMRRVAVNPASMLKDQELTDQQFLLFKRFSPVRKSFVPGKGYVRAVDLARNDMDLLRGSSLWRSQEARDHWAHHHQMSRGLRASTRGEKFENPDAEYKIYREAIKGIKDEVLSGREITTMKGKRGALNRVEFHGREMPLGAEAFAVHIGGRKGQRIMVVQPNANPRAVTHEAAHLSPKRDSWRHYQMTRDPQRMMREEARADMSSGSDYKSYNKSRNKAKTHSGYSQFAVDESARKTGELMSSLGNPFGQKQYTPEAMAEYRRIQDKIRDARGGEVADPNIGLPPPMSTKRKIAIITAAGGMAAGGGAGYYHRDELGRFARQKGNELKDRAKEAIGKSFQPWDGVHSEVSKMGPDASEVHVMGGISRQTGKRKKTARFKRIIE